MRLYGYLYIPFHKKLYKQYQRKSQETFVLKRFLAFCVYQNFHLGPFLE